MQTPKPPKWSQDQEEILRNHASSGIAELLSKLPSFTEKSIKRKATLLGIQITPLKMRKPDSSAKFEPSKHVIKNSSVEGKIAVWVPEERMMIYVKEGADVVAVIAKFRNRTVNF